MLLFSRERKRASELELDLVAHNLNDRFLSAVLKGTAGVQAVIKRGVIL